MEAACKIIESNTIRLSNLSGMNDALEFCRIKSPLKLIGDVPTENDSRIMNQLDISQQRRKQFVRLLCFCQDFNFENVKTNEKEQTFAHNLLSKGWARNRMWAQYADNHSGICLVFDKTKFQEEFKKLESDSCLIMQDRKIIYSNYFNELENIAKPTITINNMNDDFSDYYLGVNFQDFLFQKCEDFRDENECRFGLIDKELKSENQEVFVKFKDSLKAVILGERFTTLLNFNFKYMSFFDIKEFELFRIEWNCGIPDLITQN